MQNNKIHARILFLAQAAIIAALYAAVTLAVPFLSYGPVQFRLAEALTILPVLTPAAIPGLAIGCFIANLGSPYGMVDIIFGTLASLLASICTYRLRNIQWKRLPWLSALMPVLFNGVIIGAMLAYVLFDTFAWQNMLLFGSQVAAGQFVVVFALGLPLTVLLRKTRIFAAQN